MARSNSERRGYNYNTGSKRKRNSDRRVSDKGSASRKVWNVGYPIGIKGNQ